MSAEATERDDDPTALAAEYVLGLLGPKEMADADLRVVTDPDFRREVEDWQEHFAAMTNDVPLVLPPAMLKSRIEEQLGGKSQKPFAEPQRPPRPGLLSRLGWGFGGAIAGAAVAGVALYMVVSPTAITLPPETGRAPLVAEVTGPDDGLRFLASFEGDQLRLRRTAGFTPPGRVLELWAIEGDNPPRSLGLLPAAEQAVITLPQGDLAAGAVLAVSDEPPGGSPTGAPTGDVLAVGELTDL